MPKKSKPALMNYKVLGQVLAAARRRQGRTLRDVAAITNVSFSTLCVLERGHPVSFDTVGVIADYLGLPMKHLLPADLSGLAAVVDTINSDPLTNEAEKATLVRMMTNIYQQLTKKAGAAL